MVAGKRDGAGTRRAEAKGFHPSDVFEGNMTMTPISARARVFAAGRGLYRP